MNPDIKVYCQNRPPLAQYAQLETIASVVPGELANLVAETGNHWRKIVNVYAKLMYALSIKTKDAQVLNYQSWQGYRDHCLLQHGSRTELAFYPPSSLACSDGIKKVHLIMGKTYAKQFLPTLVVEPLVHVQWLDADFAVDPEYGIIICPYFDYRQLSNSKIDKLVDLIITFSDQLSREGR